MYMWCCNICQEPEQAGLQEPLQDSSGAERRWLVEGMGDTGREPNVHLTALTVGTEVVEGQVNPTPEITGIAKDDKDGCTPERQPWEIEGP